MIIFDVGANSGNNSKEFLQYYNAKVYAFEPTPYLLQNFLLPIKREYEDRFIIVPCAVSNYNGKANFNIAGQEDWGCSSLKDFADRINNGCDPTWEGRTDFKVTESINVQVIKLKDFIEENKIKSIDYLHIDTQGSDLEVLQGLEEYISIIKEGVVEAARNKEVALYKNQHTLDDIQKFLQQNEFIITNIQTSDGRTYNESHELNIYFKNTRS